MVSAAHAKLPELARARSDLLLTFHVTYCGNLGWHDSYSLDLPTQLQRRFLAADISPEVYTLALIAGGKLGAININNGASEHAFGAEPRYCRAKATWWAAGRLV